MSYNRSQSEKERLKKLYNNSSKTRYTVPVYYDEREKRIRRYEPIGKDAKKFLKSQANRKFRRNKFSNGKFKKSTMSWKMWI